MQKFYLDELIKNHFFSFNYGPIKPEWKCAELEVWVLKKGKLKYVGSSLHDKSGSSKMHLVEDPSLQFVAWTADQVPTAPETEGFT